nr:murein biosynthesis integral membrane protein MurJ [Frankia sp. BMG5.23]
MTPVEEEGRPGARHRRGATDPRRDRGTGGGPSDRDPPDVGYCDEDGYPAAERPARFPPDQSYPGYPWQTRPEQPDPDRGLARRPRHSERDHPERDHPVDPDGRRGAPRFDAPRFDAPRFDAPRHEDRRQGDPRYDGARYDGPRHPDPRHDGPRHPDPRHDDPASSRDERYPRSADRLPAPGAPRMTAGEQTRKLPATSGPPPPPPHVPPPSEGGPPPGPRIPERSQRGTPPLDDGRTSRLPTPPGVGPVIPIGRSSWRDTPDRPEPAARPERRTRADRSRRDGDERRRPSLSESRPTVALPRSNVRRIPPEPARRDTGTAPHGSTTARRDSTTARRGSATMQAGSPAEAGPGLGRASGTMAIGTIVSRASGFLRTVAIAAAIGTGAVSQAYNVANTTPNILYDLLLGGVLTSVVVPVMVRTAKEDPDGGDAFASSLLTLMILGLGAVVAVGMLIAPWIISLYLHAGSDERALAATMLRWFLPQIVFYGVGATIGAILNVRQSFTAPMFAPILNNLLVIVTCLGFTYFIAGPRPPGVDGPKAITDTQVTVLCAGTTLGVVVMTLALLPSLRKVGFHYRPRLDMRHPELRSTARLAGWTLLFVVISQAGYLVIVNLSTATTAYTIYTYGYQIFQLPYAIIGVSVITALLPRMSGHAAQGRSDLVRADISMATRITITAIVPAALFILALGRPIAVAVFHHGATGYGDAVDIGDTLSAFALALVPFSLFQVQLRVFYAYQDSRTPALVNIGVVAVNVIGALVLTVVVPEEHRAVALALSFATAYLMGLAATSALLHRRLGGIDGNRTVRVITRVAISAGIGAVLASLLARGVRAVVGEGWLGSGIAVVLAAAVGGGLFLAVGTRTGIHEINALLAEVNGRLGGRLPRPPGRSSQRD